MRVLELWRYPVKSLQGERLSVAEIGRLGITGDRSWALFDRDTGLGLTARRVPDLLFAAARLREDGGVEVVLPDGTVTTDDGVMSDWLGRRVELRAATPGGDVEPTYESPVDEEHPEPEVWEQWNGAPGPFHDSPRIRLSLVSTGTLGAWDRRRFRANVVLDGKGEEQLETADAQLGAVRVRLGRPIPRCVMVTRPQPGGIGRDTSVLKTIHRERDGLLAVRAAVVVPGTVRTGDLLRPVRAETGRVRTVEIRPGEETIRLGQLLKLVDAVPTGAQVKDVLFSGAVRVNGEPEERRGRQLRRGDVVSVEGMEDVRVG